MSWTPERLALLQQRWAEGKSSSAIAKELGGITRNAVIGKVHALNLGRTVKARTHTKEEALAALDAATNLDDIKALLRTWIVTSHPFS